MAFYNKRGTAEQWIKEGKANLVVRVETIDQITVERACQEQDQPAHAENMAPACLLAPISLLQGHFHKHNKMVYVDFSKLNSGGKTTLPHDLVQKTT